MSRVTLTVTASQFVTLVTHCVSQWSTITTSAQLITELVSDWVRVTGWLTHSTQVTDYWNLNCKVWWAGDSTLEPRVKTWDFEKRWVWLSVWLEWVICLVQNHQSVEWLVRLRITRLRVRLRFTPDFSHLNLLKTVTYLVSYHLIIS